MRFFENLMASYLKGVLAFLLSGVVMAAIFFGLKLTLTAAIWTVQPTHESQGPVVAFFGFILYPALVVMGLGLLVYWLQKKR
jgi:hypothetical protein